MATPNIITSGLNRNSYISVEEANQYFCERPNSDLWVDIETANTPEEQENLNKNIRALIFATKVIDAEFNFAGLKNDREQRLEFPRRNLYDKEGYLIDNTSIPRVLKDATAEMAYSLIRSDRIYRNEPSAGTQGSLRRLKADDVELEYQDGVRGGANVYGTIPDYVRELLRPFFSGGASVRNFEVIRG